MGIAKPEARHAMLVWVDRDRFRVAGFAVGLLVVGATVLRVVGVPSIDWHPPTHYLGIMDPGCGGTRAMYRLLTGDFAGAAHYNPVVFPLVAGAALVAARFGYGRLTGRWLEAYPSGIVRRVLWIGLAVGVALLGVRQQLHADLLA